MGERYAWGMGGDWVWYLGAALLGAGALWLFLWAWWGDRSRGRARCGRCWYSLDVLLSNGDGLPVCPECGWKGKKRGVYFRARRRRVWACAAALVAIGAAVCGLAPKVRRDGVWSIAPTWVMWGVLSTPYRSDGFEAELAGRIVSAPDEAEYARRLYEAEPKLRLVRAVWVRNIPLRCARGTGFARGAGGPAGGGLFFTVPGNEKNNADLSFYPQSHENWWQPSRDLIDARHVHASGAIDVIWTVSSRKSWSRLDEVDGVAWVDSIDKAMSPVEMNRERFIALTEPKVFVLPTTERLALSLKDSASLEAGLALGCKVELVKGETVYARGRWWQSASEPLGSRPVVIQFILADGKPRPGGGEMPAPLERYVKAGCVVRFSTDVEMALSAFDCDKYWRGSFEVPLEELVK